MAIMVAAWRGVAAGLAMILMPTVAAMAAPKRVPPYWVSLSARTALLRAGPGTNFPATWRYVRPNMPLKVVQIREDWRRVRDPGGTEGWMRASLLTDQRTAMVKEDVSPMRAAPDPEAKVVWRAEPGVVGRIARCSPGWCRFDVHGHVGYIETRALWGVDEGETFD